MVRLSRKEAIRYFESFVLPRRVRNWGEERKQLEKYDRRKVCYRKVLPGETDRGELYPVWNAGLETFAQFGIGVGLYYFQLIILFAIFFFLAFIVSPTVYEYYTSNRGIDDNNHLLKVSSACTFTNVTATIGCPDGQDSCIIRSRENCPLSLQSILLDLVMSLGFCVAILVARFAENKIIEDLDEAIQTVSDYSVCVLDPTEDADNPDEWFEFFSRFGKVRYITVFRENEEVLRAVSRLHAMDIKIEEYRKTHDDKVTDRFQHLLQLRATCKKKLDFKCKKHYPVCRVYCTFEKEEQQRLCLQELEVPDINAVLNIKDYSNTRLLFRNENVLNVKEPCEPDNILWANLSTNKMTRLVSSIFSVLISVGLLVAVWFITDVVGNRNPSALGIVIGCIDSILPSIFELLTNMNYPNDEGRRQGELQMRLFGARLLITTVLPYFQSPWDQALSFDFISQIINVQLFACFLSPVVSFFDISGVIQRNFTSFRKAETQAELNQFWRGSNWTLADKYTAIAKIVFVSMYYSLLTPIALVFATIAFGLTFFVDRFLLLRRYKPIPMINEKIAVQMRQEILLAIAAHMYITCRYIYSWPMDQAYQHDNGDIEKVDKYPIYQIWLLGRQPWQAEGQKSGLVVYQIGTLVVWAVTVYIWVFSPLWKWITRLLCKRLNIIGETQGINFSDLDRVIIYEPTINRMDKVYRCAHTVDVRPHHRPHVEDYEGDVGDLTDYVPLIHRAGVLSIVKYYGDEQALENGQLVNVGVGGDAYVPGKSPGMMAQQQRTTTTESYLDDDRNQLVDTADDGILPPIAPPKDNGEPLAAAPTRSARIISSRLRDANTPSAPSSSMSSRNQFRYVTLEDNSLAKVPASVPVAGESLLERIRPREVQQQPRWHDTDSDSKSIRRSASRSVRTTTDGMGSEAKENGRETEMVPPAAPRSSSSTRQESKKYLVRGGDDTLSPSTASFNPRRSLSVRSTRDRVLPMPEMSDSPPKENFLRGNSSAKFSY